MPRLRPGHGLFFLAIAALAFAFGLWVSRPSAPLKPPAWLADWQGAVLTPLADDHLTLGQLHEKQKGELWLTRDEQGPELAYRAHVVTDDGPWRLEAELALSDAERASLEKATDIAPGSPAQALSEQLLDQLAAKPVAAIALAPQEDLAIGRLGAAYGQPRVTLQTEEGEAWIYPDRGLTLMHKDGILQWLRVVPSRTFLKTPPTGEKP
ncbi:hypothetical protein D3C76_678510 [compost metagenome]|uniref:DUF4340 domain-containing protein n=1 Tax=Pseudomonas jinjuensis TaxID=198616 RepID=A0A1H0BDX8_9PSED|nr:hypothetical protein [Pseudomonas jinjuensis]SDN43839.1 hypothetical protein SAMN05216193_10335 [Pseudomonas jinjuensis]